MYRQSIFFKINLVSLILSNHITAAEDQTKQWNCLIEKPQVALFCASRTFSDFHTKAIPIILKKLISEKDQKNLEEIEKEYKEKLPYFSLSECLCTAFNRKTKPKARNTFKNTIVEKALSDPQTELHVVSFASGGLFQDATIVAEILKKKPTITAVHITFIDTMYSVLKIFEPQASDISELSLFDIAKALEKNKKKSETALGIYTMALRCKQFKKMCAHFNPKLSAVNLNLVENVDDFSSNNTDKTHSDYVLAADLGEDPVIKKTALTDWAKLCAFTLDKNPSAFCLLLGSDGHTYIEQITSEEKEFKKTRTNII